MYASGSNPRRPKTTVHPRPRGRGIRYRTAVVSQDRFRYGRTMSSLGSDSQSSNQVPENQSRDTNNNSTSHENPMTSQESDSPAGQFNTPTTKKGTVKTPKATMARFTKGERAIHLNSAYEQHEIEILSRRLVCTPKGIHWEYSVPQFVSGVQAGTDWVLERKLEKKFV